jgi:hypothetical protein
VTTYTYDPSGIPTATGSANDWPFQYQALEKEFTDPAPYYYTGGGQFYSPQLVRSLSETSQTSSQGGGPSGGSIAAPSGGGNGSFGSWLANDEENNLQNYFSFGNLGVFVGDSESGFIVPVGAIAGIIEQWISFFDWLFGSSGPPPTPPKLLHQRHPLYDQILEIRPSETPTEGSSAPTESESTAPSTPCNPPPLQLIEDNTSDGPGNAQWCKERCVDLALERGINRDKAPDQSMWFYRCYNQCMGTGDYPEWRPYFPRNHNTVPDSSSNFQVPKISPWWAVIPFLPSLARALGAAAGF